MKILISSHFFHPSVGGIQEVTSLLAREFVRAGHVVKVVTQTLADQDDDPTYTVHRRPAPVTLMRLVQWCDVFLHSNISLQTAWPLFFSRRPWVIAHHTWLTRVDGSIGGRDYLKRFVLRRARNIAVSEAVRRENAPDALVIGNPYRDDVFRNDLSIVRDRDLIFVGRLVSDKGLDLLLEALAITSRSGLTPSLTVVGEGPEKAALRKQIERLNLTKQVNFAGQKTGSELAALLNRHRIIVVPSRWNEPFGVVALEGMACGCVPLVADCGGLPEVIGSAGVKFRHNDIGDAASMLMQLLSKGADLSGYREAAPAHLAAHSSRAVAARYLAVLKELVGIGE